MTNNEILDLKIYGNDSNDKTTIREYFQELLLTLFDELDSFSGKRPLGDSDWWTIFEEVFIDNGIIEGNKQVDKYGDIEFYYSSKDYWNKINELIKCL